MNGEHPHLHAKLTFTCPDCGGHTLAAVLKYEAGLYDLAFHMTGGRPGMDVALHRYDGCYLAYNEKPDEALETVCYKCACCGKVFDHIDSALEHCSVDGGRLVNCVYVPDTAWNASFKDCEVADIVSYNLFDMKNGREVLETVEFINGGKLFDTDEDAASFLGIQCSDVEDDSHCIVLGSTGRVLVL